MEKEKSKGGWKRTPGSKKIQDIVDPEGKECRKEGSSWTAMPHTAETTSKATVETVIHVPGTSNLDMEGSPRSASASFLGCITFYFLLLPN